MANYNTPVTALSGQIVEALTSGAKIVKTAYDGVNHYILVELPKGGEWRYQQFETTRELYHNEPENLNKFSLMVSYNGSPREVEKKFRDDYVGKKLHIEKYQPELLKK